MGAEGDFKKVKTKKSEEGGACSRFWKKLFNMMFPARKKVTYTR